MQIILAKIIKRERLALRLTQQEIADKLGIKRSKWASYEENRAKPKAEELLKIAKFFGINIEELLTGCGSALPFSAGNTIHTKGHSPQTYTIPMSSKSMVEEPAVPLYTVETHTGMGSIFQDVRLESVGDIHIPNMPTCDGAVYVVGDSMYPLINSGDIVLYKKVKRAIEALIWGEIYLIQIIAGGNNYSSIKYLHMSNTQEHIRLVSHNKNHEDKEVPFADVCHVALVKASIRRHVLE